MHCLPTVTPERVVIANSGLKVVCWKTIIQHEPECQSPLIEEIRYRFLLFQERPSETTTAPKN